MSFNSFGNLLKLTTFGESHGQAIGGIIDGFPAGVKIDLAAIQNELDRRKPGQSKIVTQRKEPDTVEFLSGIFESFSDAPDGYKEELKEITWGIGSEYNFQDAFALRAGYFNESLEKGSRRYFTLGTGFSLNFADIDISYLFSTSRVRSPLENTLRFSMTFNMDNPQLANEED